VFCNVRFSKRSSGTHLKKRVSFSGKLPTKDNPDHIYPSRDASKEELLEYANSRAAAPKPPSTKEAPSYDQALDAATTHASNHKGAGQRSPALLVDVESLHEIDDQGGYYDANGGYTDKDGGYTDTDGCYYDAGGTYLGYYDESGAYDEENAVMTLDGSSPAKDPDSSGEFTSFVTYVEAKQK